mmetsp:Transcript_34613/g.45763  ORF Transcript_34613/g.45763 Transcript_34613/m.45763 type:complete len:394 (+) Transcript_34613:111-1292(+)
MGVVQSYELLRNLVLSCIFTFIILLMSLVSTRLKKKVQKYQINTIKSPFLLYGVSLTIFLLFVQSVEFGDIVPLQLIIEHASYSFCVWASLELFGMQVMSPSAENYMNKKSNMSQFSGLSFRSLGSKSRKISLASRSLRSGFSGRSGFSHHSHSISSISSPSYPSGASYSRSTLNSILPSEVIMDKIPQSQNLAPNLRRLKNLYSESEKIVVLLLFEIMVSVVTSCLIADYQTRNPNNLHSTSLHHSLSYQYFMFALHGVYFLGMIGCSLYRSHILQKTYHSWMVAGSLLVIIVGLLRDLLRSSSSPYNNNISAICIILSFTIASFTILLRICLWVQIKKYNSNLIFPNMQGGHSIGFSINEPTVHHRLGSPTALSHFRIEEGNEEDCKSEVG